MLFGGVLTRSNSSANFLARDILIRDVGIAHSLRVTAGTEEETTYFLETLATLSR